MSIEYAELENPTAQELNEKYQDWHVQGVHYRSRKTENDTPVFILTRSTDPNAVNALERLAVVEVELKTLVEAFIQLHGLLGVLNSNVNTLASYGEIAQQLGVALDIVSKYKAKSGDTQS